MKKYLNGNLLHKNRIQMESTRCSNNEYTHVITASEMVLIKTYRFKKNEKNVFDKRPNIDRHLNLLINLFIHKNKIINDWLFFVGVCVSGKSLFCWTFHAEFLLLPPCCTTHNTFVKHLKELSHGKLERNLCVFFAYKRSIQYWFVFTAPLPFHHPTPSRSKLNDTQYVFRWSCWEFCCIYFVKC